MHFTSVVGLALLAGSAAAAPAPLPQDADPTPTVTIVSSIVPTAAATNTAEAADQLDILSQLAFNTTQLNLLDDSNLSKRSGQCTLQNLEIRREWSTFSSSEKTAYINAVLCMQSKPAKTPTKIIPGVRNRYDDWVGTHINQTGNIHYTGTFLAWHRWFLWEFNQALRNECGYTGVQPYWDWSFSAITGLENSPVFDGSMTSMSGNGAKVANQGNIVLTMGDLPPVTLPSGTGGGCVTSGPFKNMKVNLGPASLSLPGGSTGAAANPLAYNPRCLKRDLTNAINRQYANASSVVKLILQNDDIESFQMTMQGVPGTGDIGVHGGGHYAMGGDPGRDVFTSPGDPAFWLHHGMIDRVWWIWQNLNLPARQNALAQTNTFLNQPPSPDTTLNTMIDLGYAAGKPSPMKNFMSTIGGPFCYIYL